MLYFNKGDGSMNLEEKKIYVQTNLGLVPKSKLQDFLFNFACVFTKNSVGMESGHNPHLQEVVLTVRNCKTDLPEIQKRNVINNFTAYQDMLTYVTCHKDNVPPLNEAFLKDIHAQIVKDILPAGGMYRLVNITIHGSNHVPCDYVKVYDKMNKYFSEIQDDSLSPMEQVAFMHLQLCKVHPFLDGNGRCARIVLNYGLIRRGYTPIIIPASRRLEYFSTLESFKIDKDMKPFIHFLEDLLNHEYDRLIELIEMAKADRESE